MGLGFATAAFGLKAASSVFGGVSANKAAKREAELREQQGRLEFEEALEEADRVSTQVRKFRAEQSMAFIKSGVSLQGSPLLVTEETRQEGEKEVRSIRRRGRRQLDLSLQGANIVRSGGRAAFIEGIFGASNAGLDLFSTFNRPSRAKNS